MRLKHNLKGSLVCLLCVFSSKAHFLGFQSGFYFECSSLLNFILNETILYAKIQNIKLDLPFLKKHKYV